MKHLILQDTYHMPYASKDLSMKTHMKILRKNWIGVQVYLKSGIRLVHPAATDVTPGQHCTGGDVIQNILANYGKPIKLVRDTADDVIVGPGGRSSAHPAMSYGAIASKDFYEKFNRLVEDRPTGTTLYQCSAKATSDTYQPHLLYDSRTGAVAAAQRNPKNMRPMADTSDHPLLDNPEFDAVRMQAVAFERLFDMHSHFDAYVDHVQNFPNRTK